MHYAGHWSLTQRQKEVTSTFRRGQSGREGGGRKKTEETKRRHPKTGLVYDTLLGECEKVPESEARSVGAAMMYVRLHCCGRWKTNFSRAGIHSISHSGGSQCTRPIVYRSHCVPGALSASFIVYLSHCAPISLSTNPIALCTSVSLCTSLIVYQS